MKLQSLLPALLLALSASASSQTPLPPPPAAPPASRFEQHKAMLVARIQAHIAREQSLLSCVQAAQNHAAVRACRLTARSTR